MNGQKITVNVERYFYDRSSNNFLAFCLALPKHEKVMSDQALYMGSLMHASFSTPICFDSGLPLIVSSLSGRVRYMSLLFCLSK